MKINHTIPSIALFLFPVFFVTAVFSLIEQAFPNTIASPLWNKLSILPGLFVSNIWVALKLMLFDVHLLAIQSVQQADIVWGVYWSLSDIILLIITAILFLPGLIRWASFSRKQKYYLMASIILCWSASFEIWLSGCCTGGPDWWLEVLFLFKAYVSNPYLDIINWQGIYQNVADVSMILRTILFISGVLMLRLIVLKK